jgi:hypothetical protein
MASFWRAFAMVADARSSKSPTFARVWQIYDDHRTCLLHKKYFEAKVTTLQNKILYLDIFCIVGTSTTGVAGWALWSQPGFAIMWAIIAGGAATATGIKPVLKWDDKALKCNERFTEYSALFRKYNTLVRDIAAADGLTKSLEERFTELDRESSEIPQIPMDDKKLVAALELEVNKEFPVESYWSP